MRKDKRNEELQERLDNEIKNATHVENDIDLRTAIGLKKLVIISSDLKLYERLLKKAPKESIASGSKKLGGILIGLGAFLTIATSGFLAFVGVPIAGAGAALGATGLVLDDYKDYSLFLSYSTNTVMFIKTKGTPCLELPNGSIKK